MAVHGKIGQFQPSIKSWESYSERLSFYFSANGITTATKKHSILLTVCGPATFQLLRSLVQPAKLDDTTYDTLTGLLKKHYDPAPSAIVQRYKFHTRVRETTESVATYVAELKALGRHCNFGTALNEMVRDRLVCGINDGRIQRALLQEPDLTFEKALEITQGIEAAGQDVQKLQLHTQPIRHVHKNNYSRPAPPPSNSARSSQQCYRCGGNHRQSTCRFKDATCRYCGKKGHIMKVCKSKARTESTTKKENYMYQRDESADADPSQTDHKPAPNEDIPLVYSS